jgi:Arc/MetJ family transcription regulator
MASDEYQEYIFLMSITRTTVLLDEELLKQTKHIAHVDTATAAITFAMTELVRKAALGRLADLIGTDEDPIQEVPRRRPPNFENPPVTSKGAK